MLYTTIWHNNMDEFNKLVNDALKKGWILHGAMQLKLYKKIKQNDSGEIVYLYSYGQAFVSDYKYAIPVEENRLPSILNQSMEIKKQSISSNQLKPPIPIENKNQPLLIKLDANVKPPVPINFNMENKDPLPSPLLSPVPIKFNAENKNPLPLLSPLLLSQSAIKPDKIKTPPQPIRFYKIKAPPGGLPFDYL